MASLIKTVLTFNRSIKKLKRNVLHVRIHYCIECIVALLGLRCKKRDVVNQNCTFYWPLFLHTEKIHETYFDWNKRLKHPSLSQLVWKSSALFVQNWRPQRKPLFNLIYACAWVQSKFFIQWKAPCFVLASRETGLYLFWQVGLVPFLCIYSMFWQKSLQSFFQGYRSISRIVSSLFQRLRLYPLCNVLRPWKAGSLQ